MFFAKADNLFEKRSRILGALLGKYIDYEDHKELFRRQEA